MKQLINRSYKAIRKRGLINDNTQKAEFINKAREELQEVVDAYILEDKTEDDYIEELTDLATVCMMQIKHLNRDFTKEFEKVVRKNEKRCCKSRVGIEEINIACDMYGISITDMYTRTRKREIVIPRQLLMFYFYKIKKYKSGIVADVFNMKHSTVIHAIKCYRNDMSTNKEYRRKARELFKELIRLDKALSE